MPDVEDLNRSLQKAFMFPPSDLEANNRHELSRRQMALIRGAARLGLFGIFIFSLLMLVGMPVLFVALNSRSPDASAAESLRYGLIAGGIGFVLGGASFGYYLLRNGDQRKGRLTASQGAAQPLKGKQYEYQVRIGDANLRVGLAGQPRAFRPGVTYRVYHVKQGSLDSVLSAEALPEAVASGSERFVALNAALIGKSDPEAERSLNTGLAHAGMAIFVAIALSVIGIPLAFVLAAALSPLVQGAVYLVVLAGAVLFPFAALGLLGRAAPEAADQLAEAKEVTQQMVDDKLEDDTIGSILS